MTYASTLTILSGAEDDVLSLTVAARLAHESGGVARCVLALPMLTMADWSVATGGYYLSSELIDEVQKGNDEVRAKCEALLREIAGHEALGTDGAGGRFVLAPEQSPSQFILTGETPLTDLMIASQSVLSELGRWSGLIADGVLRAHSPLLIVRRLPADGVVAIAWDGSDAAGNAVRAALPLLRRAEKVVVLQDLASLRSQYLATAAPERLTAYLALHDVKVADVIRASRHESLTALSRIEGAELLVAGAFGHSRLMEELAGGVTDTLLRPVSAFNLLMAH